MTEQNPHAVLIDEYCADWKMTNEPWVNWQFESATRWIDCRCHPEFDPKIKYRRKPKTININGFDVPMPLSVKPELGSMYYAAIPTSLDFYNENEWENDAVDIRCFERGFCHLDKQSAIDHAKALLSFTVPPYPID